MCRIFEFLKYYFQKKIVSAETISRYTVFKNIYKWSKAYVVKLKKIPNIFEFHDFQNQTFHPQAKDQVDQNQVGFKF